MIQIKHTKIFNIPILELFENQLEDAKLPTIVFYHGWESYKERVLEHGLNLAAKGFRVLLPDAIEHGERAINDFKKPDIINFWEIVNQSVQEFSNIIEYYIKNEKTDKNKIGVGGVSMGGITTSAILTQYSFVKAAAILMGNPSPVELTKWMINHHRINDKKISEILDEETITTHLNKLSLIDLSLQPEKISNRYLYFWHGAEDNIVPIHLTQKFVDGNANTSHNKNIVFDVSEELGHKVPRTISFKMAQFLKDKI